MLTELEKVSFGIYKLLFSYVPGLPFGFTPNYENLYVSKSPLRWIWLLLALSDCLLIALANSYVVLTHVFLEWKKGLGFTQIFLLVGGTLFVLIIIILISKFILVKDEILKAMNAVFQITEDMMRRFRPEAFNSQGKYDNEGKPDVLGTCACIIAFSQGSSPVWLTLAVIFADFDPFITVANDLLPDAEYRSFSTILIITLFRFITLLISTTEILKLLTFFLLILIVSLRNLLEFMHHLLHKMKGNTEQFLTYYLQIIAINKLLDSFLSEFFLILMTSAFWGTVVGTWVAVMGYGKMEPHIYGFLLGCLAICVGITGFFIKKFRAAIAMTNEIVARRRKEAKVLYFRVKTRKTKRLFKRTEALTPIQFNFGPFFPFSIDFFLEYLNCLQARIVDAILLFDLDNV
ncbi:unnamed protein product [Orchesella dallaii]|uniref:Gustatory receptor n=1 Tax=Orchesella dallaii TaxID=48710 RepID=A0ABP1RQ17_9HEXA